MILVPRWLFACNAFTAAWGAAVYWVKYGDFGMAVGLALLALSLLSSAIFRDAEP